MRLKDKSKNWGRFGHAMYLVALFMAFFTIAAICGAARALAAADLGSSLLYEEITRDFAPIPAIVMDVTGNTATIDKGKVQGVVGGDLFEVYGKGLAVKSPDKKEETIGYLKKPVAMLEVTQVEEQKAICRILYGRASVNKGLPATRYSDMAAACETKNDSELAQKGCQILTQTLPDLIWLPSSSVPSEILDAKSMETLGIKMLFSFEADRLKVFGPGLNLLRQYPLGQRNKNAKTGAPKTSNIAGPMASENPGQKAYIKNIDLASAKLIGRLPEETLQVAIMDLNRDGKLKMVYLTPSGLYICPFRQAGPVASYKFYGPGHLMGFSAMPDKGWIALNVVMDKAGMRSMLLRYENGHIIEAQSDINLWLAFLNMADNGKTQLMAGQSFDQDDLFGQKFYRLEPEEKGILYADTLRFPPQFSILGATWARLDDSGNQELIMIDASGRILIYNLGQLIWSTSAPVTQPLAKQGFLKSCLIQNQNGTGPPSFLFAGRNISDTEEMEDSIMMLTWQGGKYSLQAISKPLGGRISGISDMDGHLVFCLSRADLQKKGRYESTLYEIDLNKN